MEIVIGSFFMPLFAVTEDKKLRLERKVQT